MTDFEKVLQECLYNVEEGNSSVDECLMRYPKYAQQLEPVLLTSAYLQQGREARPSAAFKARVKSKLVQQMYARPRQPARSKFVFMRLAVSLAALILALLVVGTAYAQGVLPGNAFYPWKLASENAWRTVSFHPVETDLAITQRRMDELVAVRDNPVVYPQALQAYLEMVAKLKSETDTQNESRILTILDSQAEELNQSGIALPTLDQDVLPPSDEPTLIPISTPTAIPVPVLETPHVDLTRLPSVIPTVQVPSKIIPTVEVLPNVIPTLELPPSIP